MAGSRGSKLGFLVSKATPVVKTIVGKAGQFGCLFFFQSGLFSTSMQFILPQNKQRIKNISKENTYFGYHELISATVKTHCTNHTHPRNKKSTAYKRRQVKNKLDS